MNEILSALGLKEINPGCSNGQGGFSRSQAGPLLASINPATGQVIAQLRCGTASDYRRLVARGQEHFKFWRMVPPPQRGELVRRLGQRLRQLKDPLGSLVSLETGKSKVEGDGEVQEMIDLADFAVGQSRMLYGLTMASERPRHRLFEQWHPLGQVGVITAFNFPVAVWAWNALLAAICGDLVLWKPSSQTPLTALAVQRICQKVCQEMGFGEVFSLLITPDRGISSQMLEDKHLPLISFTGSTAAGREVAQRVGARLGRCILELSGNNGVIVDETADLNLVLPALVFGAIGTAGQRCTTTRRVLVHQSQLEKLKQRLLAAYAQVRVGDPLDASHHMGPLINAQAVRLYEKTILRLKATGGKLLFGGKKMPGPGYFVEPALAQVEPDNPLLQEEAFIPLLYLVPVKSFEQALALHNQASHGLSSALFTTDLRRQEEFLSPQGSDCGLANINLGTSGAEIGGAFGGEKDTGGGRESGSDAWKGYMRRQTNCINWGSQLPLAQGIKFDLD